MKKLIIIILLAFTNVSFSQNSHQFVVGIDMANAFFKGSVNDRALDLHGKYLYRTDGLMSDNETGFLYERFDKLNFEVYGILFNKVYYPSFKNTEVAIGVENIIIHRWRGYLYKETDSDAWYWGYGFNIEPRYNFSDHWAIGIQGNYRRRTDIQKFVFSGFINLKYTL